MGSPNTNCANSNHSKSMLRKFSCFECGRRYAMEWAKKNHEKLCKERL